MSPRWPAGRTADALWLAAFLLGGAALVAPLATGSPGGPSPAPRVVSNGPGPAAAPVDPTLVNAVVRANVFAEGRVPPRSRWTPPTRDTLPPGLAPDPAAQAELARPPADPDGPPRLYGTVLDPAGSSALLWLDPATPGAQLYREGTGAAGWRVVRVSPDRVVLAAPGGGRVTLRLSVERAMPERPVRPAAPPDSTPRV